MDYKSARIHAAATTAVPALLENNLLLSCKFCSMYHLLFWRHNMEDQIKRKGRFTCTEIRKLRKCTRKKRRLPSSHT